MKPKAQVDILTSVILVIMGIAIVSTTYFWGLPLIQKQQGKTVIGRVYEQFNHDNANSLPSKIEYIANMGGEDSFTADTDGLWALDSGSNWIQFTFSSKLTNIAYNMTDWISLTSEAFCPPDPGMVGADSSSVVCARADTHGDTFNITYRVWFRNVLDNLLNPTKGYKIELVSATGGNSSAWKTIRISRGDVGQSPSNPDLIVTKIKIRFA